jgi:hypothetical protein
MKQEKVVGYGFLTMLSVTLFIPFMQYMNANLPSDSVGTAIASFFWIVYPVTIIYFIYSLLHSILS